MRSSWVSGISNCPLFFFFIFSTYSNSFKISSAMLSSHNAYTCMILYARKVVQCSNKLLNIFFFLLKRLFSQCAAIFPTLFWPLFSFLRISLTTAFFYLQTSDTLLFNFLPYSLSLYSIICELRALPTRSIRCWIILLHATVTFLLPQTIGPKITAKINPIVKRDPKIYIWKHIIALQSHPINIYLSSVQNIR